jgi:hypothetical protein
MSKEPYNKKPPPWGKDYMYYAVDDLCFPNVNRGHETVYVLSRSFHRGSFSDQKDITLIDVFPKSHTTRQLVDLPPEDYSSNSHISCVHLPVFMSYGSIVYDHNDDTTIIMDKYGNLLHIVEKPSNSVSYIILLNNNDFINVLSLGS